MEMKVTERMAAIREEVIAGLALNGATQIGTGEFIVEVTNGFASVLVTAKKDFDYDVAGARAEYEATLAARADRAQTLVDKKAAVEAEKAAKKAAKE